VEIYLRLLFCNVFHVQAFSPFSPVSLGLAQHIVFFLKTLDNRRQLIGDLASLHKASPQLMLQLHDVRIIHLCTHFSARPATHARVDNATHRFRQAKPSLVQSAS